MLPITSLIFNAFSGDYKHAITAAHILSVLMNTASPLLKTFAIYADDKLSLNEKLQCLYIANDIKKFNAIILNEYKNYQKNNDKKSDLSTINNEPFVSTKQDDEQIISNKSQEKTLGRLNNSSKLNINMEKPKLETIDEKTLEIKFIDIKELYNISERIRNKLNLRINNNKDALCESTDRLLKQNSFMKFLFYGTSMIHALIPSISIYSEKGTENPSSEWRMASIFLDSINCAAVPLLGWIPKYLTKMEEKIDNLLKSDILFMLHMNDNSIQATMDTITMKE